MKFAIGNQENFMIKKKKDIRELLSERILVLDGAMGTMLQAQGLSRKT